MTFKIRFSDLLFYLFPMKFSFYNFQNYWLQNYKYFDENIADSNEYTTGKLHKRSTTDLKSKSQFLVGESAL